MENLASQIDSHIYKAILSAKAELSFVESRKAALKRLIKNDAEHIDEEAELWFQYQDMENLIAILQDNIAQLEKISDNIATALVDPIQ